MSGAELPAVLVNTLAKMFDDEGFGGWINAEDAAREALCAVPDGWARIDGRWVQVAETRKLIGGETIVRYKVVSDRAPSALTDSIPDDALRPDSP